MKAIQRIDKHRCLSLKSINNDVQRVERKYLILTIFAFTIRLF